MRVSRSRATALLGVVIVIGLLTVACDPDLGEVAERGEQSASAVGESLADGHQASSTDLSQLVKDRSTLEHASSLNPKETQSLRTIEQTLANATAAATARRLEATSGSSLEQAARTNVADNAAPSAPAQLRTGAVAIATSTAKDLACQFIQENLKDAHSPPDPDGLRGLNGDDLVTAIERNAILQLADARWPDLGVFLDLASWAKSVVSEAQDLANEPDYRSGVDRNPPAHYFYLQFCLSPPSG